MATLHYWIQLENRPWDACPHNRDRMTGESVKQREGKDPVANVVLSSPGTGATRKVTMFKPMAEADGTLTDALILRRYLPPIRRKRAAWQVPDDRKVNPWDLNELDPSDKGTMGTIPGPVIECNVGDKVIVHFRNLDMRTKAVKKTVVVHKTCTEEVDWENQHGATIKKTVEVPCDETRTVVVQELLPKHKRTHSLHPHGFAFAAASDGAYPLSPPDKSQPIKASENATWNSVGVQDFKKGDRVPPAGTFDFTWIAGAPSEDDPSEIEPWPTTAGVWLYHDHSICDMDNVSLGAIGIIVIHNPDDAEQEVDIRKPSTPDTLDPAFLPGGSAVGPVTHAGRGARRKSYFPPPAKALYLELFHTLTGTDSGMLINGRQYLGNTPTLIAGPETLMRFGVVGMGMAEFHTFHIHGHRWVLPGPDGSDVDTIQNSAQIRAVSQFEDTRIFGPANSFVFTIQEGEFFGARDDDPFGEFHMHCHVLQHMDMGMMGSLLIVPKGGGAALALPEGVPCDAPDAGTGTGPVKVTVKNLAFTPSTVSVAPGGQVIFDFQETPHTVMTVSHPNASAITVTKDPGGDPTLVSQAVPVGQRTVTIQGSMGGQINYQCGIHGAGMSGTIKIM